MVGLTVIVYISKITDASLSFHGTALVPDSSARNLGVIFQSDLSFDQHISSVCRSSFCHIRQLRQIRPSLDLNSSIQLALVSSKLNYCNSLFYGLPDTSIKRLQRVQNSLARVIFPSLKRSDHITPTLVKLHWLPIHNRVKLYVVYHHFQGSENRQPSYLFDLLQLHNPQRSHRSSDKLPLGTPKIKTALASGSFSRAALSLWNSLPFDLHNSSSPFIHHSTQNPFFLILIRSLIHTDLTVNCWHRFEPFLGSHVPLCLDGALIVTCNRGRCHRCGLDREPGLKNSFNLI